MEAASDVALAGLAFLITLAFLLSSAALLERRAVRGGDRSRAHRRLRELRSIFPHRGRGC
jgi:hypothetical protein